MSSSITIEDIYQLFERSQAENDRRAAESERRAAESKAENDRRAAESERRAAESKAEYDRRAAEYAAEYERFKIESAREFDRRLQESRVEFERSLAQSRIEFDRSLAQSRVEFDRSLEDVKKIADQAMRSVEGLSSRWGRFVENMVEPAIVRLFQERNIDVKETHTRVKAKRGTIKMEIDILAVDDTVAVAVEVKSRLNQKQINAFIKRLGNFKSAFPAYANYDIYGAVAAIEIDAGADVYAYKQGLFVIKQSGDTVKIDNDSAFQPITW